MEMGTAIKIVILHPGLISKSVLKPRFYCLTGREGPLWKNFDMPFQEYTINILLSISPMHPRASLVATLVAQMVKNPPAMWEMRVQSPGWEDTWRRERLPCPVFWSGEFTISPEGLWTYSMVSLQNNEFHTFLKCIQNIIQDRSHPGP